MKCPDCGKEMEAGYITAGYPIRWIKKESINDFFSGPKGIRLTGWIEVHLAADLCENCGLIISKCKRKKM